MTLGEEYIEVFDELKNLSNEVSWTLGLSNLIDTLLQDTKEMEKTK